MGVLARDQRLRLPRGVRLLEAQPNAAETADQKSGNADDTGKKGWIMVCLHMVGALLWYAVG